ncbi:hypothetical protein GOBAR_AA02222 [Gossypium barbadense]|uniref:CCHC-type domain-containing protein n=1 Tax=Gossypium barbadense TaxID=3634 RepID=A0A2P5YS05_GOSBA|nr:hypothetical protein GOBAR_AA02222 [Gossypium barbadense]
MGDADGFNMDRNTKKVKFKDVGDDSAENMVVDTALASEISWKDKMLGAQNTESLASSVISDGATDMDLKFEDGDTLRSTINSILTIDFFEQIKKILVKDMETKNVEIESLVEKVAKMDIKTDNGGVGQFTRMAVFVDLEKSLTLQVLVNGRMQRVEFEALLAICFTCGKYGHLKTLCPSSLTGRSTDGGLGRVSELVANYHNQNAKILNDSKFVALENESTRLEREQPGIMETRGELVNFDQPINHGPETDNFTKASSLHFNPTFEGPIETMVNLNSKLLDPNCHSVVIFKENWDPNSNSKIGKEGVVAYNSPPISSKGHSVGNKGGNGYPGRVLNKTIRGRWGCFKPTSNPRVPLLEVMNSMAKLFSAQVETPSTKVDVQNSGVKAYDTS